MTFKPLTTALLAAAIALLSCSSARAEHEELEYKVKAAFLLNFARFAVWPESRAAEQTFSLCILGDDPFGPALTGIESKDIGGKPVQLRRLESIAAGVDTCRMLFVGKSGQTGVERVLKAVAGLPVVTVSDIEGFAKAGGMFEFKNQEGRLSFVVNNAKARESGVRISASLLNLAVQVL
jgi:hypothetical protein